MRKLRDTLCKFFQKIVTLLHMLGAGVAVLGVREGARGDEAGVVGLAGGAMWGLTGGSMWGQCRQGLRRWEGPCGA
jgi:pantothenate kinase